jgi:hypothetical protein
MEEVIGYIVSRIAGTKKSLTPVVSLDHADNRINDARNAFERFLQSKDETELTAANTCLEDSMGYIAALPPMPFKAQAQAVADAVDAVTARLVSGEGSVVQSIEWAKESLDGHSAEFNDELAKARADLDTLAQSVRDSIAAAQTEVSNLLTTASNDADERFTQLRNDIDSERTQLRNLLTQHQSEFAASQEKRLEEANAVLKTVETDVTTKAAAVLSDLESRSMAIIANSQESQDELLSKSEELLKKAEETVARANEVLGLSGAVNVATAFLEEAKDQNKMAMIWQVLTGILAVVSFGVVYVAFVHHPPDPTFSTGEFAAYIVQRLPGVLLLAPIGYWVMAQASHHRERERRAKLRGRELSSFGPFIAQLDPKEQQDLISKTAPHYFGADGAEPSNESASNEKARDSFILELVKALVGRN